MRTRDPYRHGEPPEGAPALVQDSFEERILAGVLLAAGVLGTAVGLASPRANATELVIGMILLVVGLWTLRASRSEPVV